ncbi:MAG TPA: TauD/TfdA family dioxygenase [Planctomycetota bacterium]|nr:TauD/TfdA family dioxygenase [Planctomycetota bacterium]
MKIAPRTPFGADVTGLDLRHLQPEHVDAIRAAVYEHKLLALHDVELEDAEYVAMARHFGTPQRYFQSHYHHPEFPEIFVSNNVPMDGKRVGVAGTGRMWHSDYQFFPEPLPLTFVFPRIVPPGGGRGTLFVDMVDAAARLPGRLRTALAAARCFHDAVLYYKVQPFDIDKGLGELMEEFHRQAPGADHPAIIRHPVLDRSALFVSSGFTTRVDGMSHEASRQLLADTFAWLEQECPPHTEKWHPGKLLLWDNRQVMHRSSGTLHGGPSRSYRIGVYDGLPFYPGLPVTGEDQP